MNVQHAGLCPARLRRRVAQLAAGLCMGVVAASVAAQCEVQQLYPPFSGAGDSFGHAIDFDDDTLVVGSRYSATVFVRQDPGTPLDDTDDQWLVQTNLLGQHIWDKFGESVSLDGDHLVVGAPDWSLGLGTGGRAYVFVRDDGGTPPEASDDTWTLQTELAPPTGDIGQFGCSVSLDGTWLAVGDFMGHTVPGAPGPQQGFVQMVRHDDGGTSDPRDDQWVGEGLLLPAENGAHFGAMVDLCGDELLVFGLQPLTMGHIFRFRLDDAGSPEDPTDDTWIENGEIPAPPDEEAGLRGWLARDGDRLLVAGDDAAYEFRLDDGGTPGDRLDDDWELAGILKASDDTQYDDGFGTALSLRGGRALVGSKKHGHPAASGAAYLFQCDDTATDPAARWTQVVELLLPVSFQAKNFGDEVVLAGDFAFVGESGFFQFVGPADSTYGQVRVYAMSDEPWSFVDAALAATSGLSPCLVGSGALESDALAALAIERGPPLAPAAIVLGSERAEIPFKGGLLVPLPQLVVWITTSATGDAFVNGRWPPHVPSGFELWAQVWMLDDGGPQGFSATNAVRAHAP